MIHYKTQQSKSGIKHPLVLRGRQKYKIYSSSFVPVSHLYLNVVQKMHHCIRQLLENISMQRQRVSFVVFPLCWLRISAQNKPLRSERLFVGFTEYFKAPAYCSCSETMAHLKVPVAVSSFNWVLPGEMRRRRKVIYIRQSLNY